MMKYLMNKYYFIYILTSTTEYFYDSQANDIW